MIVITQNGWDWPELYDYDTQHSTEVLVSQNIRISELLGPDGEPLTIELARPKIGFDLSRKE